MNKTFSILIKGFNNPNDFVNSWSKHYSYSNEEKYNNNILNVLNSKNSFIELFKWKNGTKDVISEKKMKVVESFYSKKKKLEKLKMNFSWDGFEKEFEPTKSSTIWKIFLLHILNPENFPIYDQHVFRCYHFMKTGEIKEIPTNKNIIYDGYKNDYKGWFNNLQIQYNLSSKLMDMSFFTFGQILKQLKGVPIEITS